MVPHHLRIGVGGVLRLDVDLGEALFVLGLTREGLHKDTLQQWAEVIGEVLVITRRPEVVDDVVSLLRDLYLECLEVPDVPVELQGVSDPVRQVWE